MDKKALCDNFLQVDLFLALHLCYTGNIPGMVKHSKLQYNIKEVTSRSSEV